MSNPIPRPSFAPNRRWKIALNVATSILALMAVLVMANYLAARHPRQWHLSSDPRFLLSPVTKQVLQAVTNQVKVVVYFDRTKPLYDFVVDLLKEYQAECPKLELNYIDYSRSPGMAKAAELEYGLTAASDGDRIIFASEGKRRVLYAKDLSEFDFSALMKGKEIKRTAFKGEQLFTSALFSLIDPRPVRVCFLQGHKEHDPGDVDNSAGYLRFTRLLQEDQIIVSKLDATALLSGGDIPSDCQLLVIANPVNILALEELQKIEAYLGAGGRLLVLLSADSLQETTGLEKLLANWGVEVGRNFVCEQHDGKVGDSRQMIVTHFANHPVVNTLARSRMLLIMPRSVGARAKRSQSADAPKVVELATTGPEGMTVQLNGRIERQQATVPLMVAVEKGAIQGMAGDRGTARIVVVGESQFLANNGMQVEANRDFARNAVNWLLSRDLLLQGVTTRSVKEYRITMTAGELTGVRWLFLAGFPGGVLVLGFLVWLRRRA